MARPGRTRLLVGGLLVALVWPLNWGLDGVRTHLLFFPLWLGYVLAVDGLTARRTGTSVLQRAGRRSAWLFALSVPLWWVFEALNLRLENWEYVGREHFGDLEYALLSSLAFSTVVPAILVTAELVRSCAWVERFSRGPRLEPTPRFLGGCLVAGASMLAALLVWPRVFFPLVWVSGVFLLEPVVQRARGRGLLAHLARGDWRPWASLWAGSLVCGFFWELWNWLSYPKWVYHVPGVDFLRVFEMPLLGYLGYLPFAMEVWLVQQLAFGRLGDPFADGE